MLLILFFCVCAAAAASAAAAQDEDPYEPPSGALPRAAPACAASAWGPSPCAYASGMVLSSTTPWRASGSQPAVVHGLAQPSETLTLTGLPPGARVSPSNPWTADAAGRWAVTLASADTSVPVNLTFPGSSGKRVVREEGLCGLTMLCSGQSNMDMNIDMCFYANETLANKGLFPDIRIKRGPDSPWSRSSASNDTLRAFSAVCYYSALHLKRELPALADVPIGLVQSSVGGTCIESWMSSEALQAAGTPPQNSTCLTQTLCQGMQPNCANYLPLILPLAPFTFDAMLWYQGESNQNCGTSPTQPQWRSYASLLPALVDSWRALFASSFTAYVFQLAPYGSVDEAPQQRSSDTLPLLREAQLAVLRNSSSSAPANAAVVVPLDLGDDGHTVYTPPSARHGGLHPRNKTEFGRRMALRFGELNGLLAAGVASTGPQPLRATLDAGGASVTLAFAPPSAAGGPGSQLRLAPTQFCATQGALPAPYNASSAYCCQSEAFAARTPHGFAFELQANGSYVLARAEVVALAGGAQGVRLAPLNASAAAGLRLQAVRHGWQGWPLCLLANEAGLPAGQFVLPVEAA